MLISTCLICSKLTRLLKDGLSGNSRTVMVATVSCGADQYHHTTNTLKYADRAKEIKTHIQVLTPSIVTLTSMHTDLMGVYDWNCKYTQGSQPCLGWDIHGHTCFSGKYRRGTTTFESTS